MYKDIRYYILIKDDFAVYVRINNKNIKEEILEYSLENGDVIIRRENKEYLLNIKKNNTFYYFKNKYAIHLKSPLENHLKVYHPSLPF